jgi:hypothetical protein
MLLERIVRGIIVVVLASFFLEALSWFTAPIPPCLIQTTNEEQAAHNYNGEDCPTFFSGSLILLERADQFIERHDKSIVAFFTVVLALSTIALWGAGERQLELIHQNAARQAGDTEILQRAYVAAELGGIRDMTGGQLVGHVGHLPATDLRDAVKKIEVHDGAWRPPIIPDTELEDHGVLPIGVRMKKGSAGTIYPGQVADSQIRDKYLYVWGRMTYVDGFKRRRHLNFCHRYPWDKRETPTGGGLLISEEHGRYHEYGNDAD